MLADCSTKPSNGAKLYDQISFAIGERFYPSPSSQHYHALDLEQYSYKKWHMKASSSSTWQSICWIPFCLHLYSEYYIVIFRM
jgi:hypothetical protein